MLIFSTTTVFEQFSIVPQALEINNWTLGPSDGNYTYTIGLFLWVARIFDPLYEYKKGKGTHFIGENLILEINKSFHKANEQDESQNM